MDLLGFALKTLGDNRFGSKKNDHRFWSVFPLTNRILTRMEMMEGCIFIWVVSLDLFEGYRFGYGSKMQRVPKKHHIYPGLVKGKIDPSTCGPAWGFSF